MWWCRSRLTCEQATHLRPPCFLVAIKDFRNVKPEFPFEIDLSGMSLSDMAFQVEARTLPSIVIFPLFLQAAPVKIAPTRDDEVEAVIFSFPVRDQLL